eukprot:3782019-Alexandrium_andersonii.AAC.1
MAESPRGQGPTPSTEAHWGPLRAAQNGCRTMCEHAFTQQLGGPRSGASSRSLGALSPTVWR